MPLPPSLSPEEYEALMDAGWRKFGQTLFRPVCRHCAECRPLRIPAAAFTPDRSQQRCLRRNADLEVRCAPPTADAARLDLYRRYQAAQTETKAGRMRSARCRATSGSLSKTPCRVSRFRSGKTDVLRAVAITDITPNTVSGVYHFHDPDCRSRGLGTFALLQTIALAQTLGKALGLLRLLRCGLRQHGLQNPLPAA